MKSRLGAERAGSYWGADPNDRAHKIETEFPSGRAVVLFTFLFPGKLNGKRHNTLNCG